MAIASINFKPVKNFSERHNLREQELDYVYSELSVNNESWKIESVKNRLDQIKLICKEGTGRSLQKKAVPIREAVINLDSHHTMADLKTLAKKLEEEFGMEIFQIHIHKDEGKSREELNYHAHILADWQDKKGGQLEMVTRTNPETKKKEKKEQYKRKGSMIKYTPDDMSNMQTIVANSLGMERGKLGSDTKRLESLEYKNSQEEKKQEALRLKGNSLDSSIKTKSKQNQEQEEKLNTSQKELAEVQKKNRARTDYLTKLRDVN